MKTVSPLGCAVRVALAGGLLWLSWPALTATMLQLGDRPGPMHAVHLVFHEAGHVLLMWAPPVVVALGGTLGQILVPLAVALSFAFRNRDPFGTAIGIWWMGHALADIAPYINDARVTRLMLLGGGTGDEIEGHDWQFILSHWGLLRWDARIGHATLFAGRLVMAIALTAAAAWVVLKLWQATGRGTPRGPATRAADPPPPPLSAGRG